MALTATDLTQDGRPFRLTTPLGKDVLLCTRWSCTEAVSMLFALRIETISLRPDIAPAELLLKQVTLHCTPDGGDERWFTGLVTLVERGAPPEAQYSSYVLHVAPPAWLLDRTPGHRVFQDLDTAAILREVCAGLKVDWQLQGEYAPAPSRTRYDESAWSFASRLMERDGLWYVYRSDANAATLVVADANTAAVVRNGVHELADTMWKGNARLTSAFQSQEPYVKEVTLGTSQLALFGRGNRESASAPAIAGRPGGWALDARGFPDSLSAQLHEYVAGAGRDPADKGGGDTSSELPKLVDDLKRQALLRVQADAVASTRLNGTSTAVGLEAGARVELRCSERPLVDGAYFILSVEHVGENGSYFAHDDATHSYRNRFSAVPHAIAYRAPRRTPWPAVRGLHTGTVVGPAAEEIFTDKHGRVRVVFDWNPDALAPNGPGDACWVRVAQMVAGPGWGTFFLPRVGQQVLVSFLGGDPDAPVVVGALYNDVNTPQVKLPDDRTQSAIRTRSSPNGSADTYNELRFEDRKDAEKVVFQAQRDFIGRIKHDSTLTVSEGNQTVTLEKGDHAMTVANGKWALTVKREAATTVEEGDLLATVKAGDATTFVSQGKSALTAAGDITMTSQGSRVIVQAATAIELVVGGSTLKITPAGIELSAPTIKVKAGATAEVTASATLTLKGAMTMIN